MSMSIYNYIYTERERERDIDIDIDIHIVVKPPRRAPSLAQARLLGQCTEAFGTSK